MKGVTEMPEARIVYQGHMQFAATSGSGHTVVMDSAPEVGGQNQGVRPMELVLAALGGCTGMDVVSILNKMRVPYTAFRLDVHGERASEHPKVYEKITLQYVFEGDGGQEEKFVRAVTLSQDKYCSVSAMLAKTASLETQVILNGAIIFSRVSQPA